MRVCRWTQGMRYEGMHAACMVFAARCCCGLFVRVPHVIVDLCLQDSPNCDCADPEVGLPRLTCTLYALTE